MKVTTHVFCLLAGLAGLAPVDLGAAPPQAIGFAVSDEIADAGNTITATVDLTSLTQVAAISVAKFSLQVDPLLLTPVSVQRGDQLAGVPANDIAVNLHADRADVSLLTGTPISLQPGTFLTVTFEVHPLARPDEGCRIDMVGVGAQEIVLLVNPDDPPPGVKADVTAGQFRVRDGLTCTQGDASGDGQVNTADAVLTLRIIAEILADPSPTQECGADANVDRKINTGDAVWILREVVGLPHKAAAPMGPVRVTLASRGGRPVLVLDTLGDLFGLDAELTFDSSAVAWHGLGQPARGLRVDVPTRGGGRRILWADAQPLGSHIEVALPTSGAGAVSVRSLTVYDERGRATPVTLPASVRWGAGGVVSRPLSLDNVPNPFNPSTTIRFALAAAGPATLDVYDTRGQRVRRLFAGPRAAGEHEVVWNGTDDGGQPVASGVYYARVHSGSHAASHRLLLLK